MKIFGTPFIKPKAQIELLDKSRNNLAKCLLVDLMVCDAFFEDIKRDFVALYLEYLEHRRQAKRENQ
jgi:hypothetical protein